MIGQREGKRMINRLVLVLLLLCTVGCDSDEKDVTVRLAVPDTTWTVVIEEVHKIGNELWVIASVAQDPDMMGAQVITTVEDSLTLAAPDLPVKFFVIGKTWNWENEESYNFIESLDKIEEELKSGKLLYKKME